SATVPSSATPPARRARSNTAARRSGRRRPPTSAPSTTSSPAAGPELRLPDRSLGPSADLYRGSGRNWESPGSSRRGCPARNVRGILVSGGDGPICDRELGVEPGLSVVDRAVGRIGRIGEDRPAGVPACLVREHRIAHLGRQQHGLPAPFRKPPWSDLLPAHGRPLRGRAVGGSAGSSSGWICATDRPRNRRGAQDRGVAMYLISRNSSIPTLPPSRPRPDIFTPPKGAPGFETRPVLSPTMPASSLSAKPSARSRFSLNR